MRLQGHGTPQLWGPSAVSLDATGLWLVLLTLVSVLRSSVIAPMRAGLAVDAVYAPYLRRLAAQVAADQRTQARLEAHVRSLRDQARKAGLL